MARSRGSGATPLAKNGAGMTRSRLERLIRAAAAVVPLSHREECLEQWLADLAHCDELGIARSQVAFGAVLSAMTYRPAGTTKGIAMSEETKHGIRLALYGAWNLAAIVWVWSFCTHLAVSGSNVGFRLPNGPLVDITLVFIGAGVAALIGGVVLGFRSLRPFHHRA